MAEEEKTFNAADPKQVDKARRNQRAASEQEANDLRSVMTTAAGRRVLWRILTKAGVHRSSYNTNAIAMAFAEGNRNLGLWLEAEMLGASTANFMQAMLEAREQSKQGGLNG